MDGNEDLSIEIIARDKSVDSINKQLERELTGYMVENPKTITPRAQSHDRGPGHRARGPTTPRTSRKRYFTFTKVATSDTSRR
ncbi:MAG: hypothetical protein WDN28_19040 [Chthoniobacter sp.]